MHDAQELSIRMAGKCWDIRDLKKSIHGENGNAASFIWKPLSVRKKNSALEQEKEGFRKYGGRCQAYRYPEGQKGYADVVMEAKEKQGDLLAVLSKAFSIGGKNVIPFFLELYPDELLYSLPGKILREIWLSVFAYAVRIYMSIRIQDRM